MRLDDVTNDIIGLHRERERMYPSWRYIALEPPIRALHHVISLILSQDRLPVHRFGLDSSLSLEAISSYVAFLRVATIPAVVTLPDWAMRLSHYEGSTAV